MARVCTWANPSRRRQTFSPVMAMLSDSHVERGCKVDTMNGTDAKSRSGIDQAEIRFLVEKNADGIIVIDEGGTVLFANPAAEEIFGRQAELLIGRPIGIPFVAGDTAEIAIHKPD